ncbi:YbaL family putative K(+) efflux transporter [Pseudoxanthomonas sp. JBR18]|uniref:YbaL family putative K(+) efflux transporter n=1 Tax=Pseudoxanthomonas sp. JBR18 TaxID=2969308 RepID=UPI002305FEAB|nr:YbaL family putative K(+) efflux transporter [Pseudoxanthomonas sp. JBR18]WCE02973.1 YbaL family putative K(+) efflux transporter [Pseudoxanthomonas sp. JBR18]
MHHDTSLIDIIAVGLAVAFLLGALANKLRLSPLVGYLVAGMVVGPFTPGFVADQDLATQLSELGVMLLMFGVGLHFSLDDLMEVKGIAIPGAIVQIAVAIGLGWALAWFMGWPLLQGFVFGLALSVASTVVLLRALEDRRMLDTRRGKIAVGWLIVEDLVMVLALVLLPALAGALGDAGTVRAAAEAGGGAAVQAAQGEPNITVAIAKALGITLLQVAAFVAVMLVIGRRVIPWTLEKVAATGSRELFTLSVLAIALGVAFGSAKLFGVSFALGAFFAGMLLNESELSHKAANDSLPLRDAFAVLFFVSVGMLFDPMILVKYPLQVLATFVIVVVGKSLAAYAIVRAFGHPRQTAFTIAASLAQIGEFSFILAGLGLSLKILPQSGHDMILAGALLSIVANPFLFAALDAWSRRQAQDAPATDTPEPDPLPGPPLIAQDHAIVIGYGRVGSSLVRVLAERGVHLVVIDDNRDNVDKAHAAGIPAIRGSAAADAVLAEAQPEKARIAVLAIPQPLEAGEAIAKLRALNPALTVLARAHSEGEVAHLLEHGADAAVLAERELAHSLAEMILSMPPYRPPRAQTAS